MLNERSVFPFGAQYLRGATPEPEDWDKDLKLAKSLGFNTMRAWICWGYLEPKQGEINFNYIDTFLDTMGKYNLKAILLFNLYGCPEWATRKYPNCRYVDNEGIPAEPNAASSIPTGGWPGLCFDHNIVREIAENFMRKVLEHLKDRPEISYWEPMNEPILDPQRYSNKMYCYCSATRAKFTEWLKKKYGTLNALNEAWGRSHSAWEDVRPPTYQRGYTQWIDWRRFLIERTVNVVKWRTEVIKSVAPQPVMAHTYEAMCCCDFVTKAYDDWKLARVVDKWGVSRFPSIGEGATIMALEADAVRNQACGKEFWQSELRGGRGGGGLNLEKLPSPEEFSLWTWASIEHGAKGVLYWQFRNERHGDESGNMGLCDNDGKPLIMAKTASKICNILNENADLFRKVKYPEPEVAILMSPLSYMVNWCAQHNVNLSMDSFTGYYRIFWEANIPVDILHEEFVSLAKLKEYKLLILPFPICLASSFNKLLFEYVKNGGTVLTDPAIDLFDHRQRMSRIIPGEGLTELFGCQEREINSTEKPVVQFGNLGTVKLLKTHFVERFTKIRGQVLASYFNGDPAIIINSYGKGKAILSGVNLGLSCTPPRVQSGNLPEPETITVKNFVISLVEKIGISRKILINDDKVTATLLTAEKEGILFVSNHLKEEKKCQISLEESLSGLYDLEKKEEIPLLRKDEKTIFEISFKGMGTKIFKTII